MILVQNKKEFIIYQVYEYARVSQRYKYALLYLNIGFLDIPDYPWIFLNIPKYTKIYVNMPKSTWMAFV